MLLQVLLSVIPAKSAQRLSDKRLETLRREIQLAEDDITQLTADRYKKRCKKDGIKFANTSMALNNSDCEACDELNQQIAGIDKKLNVTESELSKLKGKCTIFQRYSSPAQRQDLVFS